MEGLMAEKAAETADWLSTLESKVHAAAERLHALHEENAALRNRIGELEQKLAAAPSTPSADTGASQWEEERREIRERVERLTRTLEELAGV
jgi:predicted  nucleic acid-binding Zn-ribbon protein